MINKALFCVTNELITLPALIYISYIEGFLWRYGTAKQIDIGPMLEKMARDQENKKAIFGKKVTQYTMNGKRVAIYPTIADAAIATGVQRSEISLVMQRTRYSAGGFYWQRGDGPPLIDLSKHVYGNAVKAKKLQRPVRQYAKDGKYLQTFKSIKAAAQAAGVDEATVTGALTGRHATAGGYKWRYVKKKDR